MTRNEIRFKTFLKAYERLSSDNRTIKRFILDKRLTRVEKNIIKAFVFIKKGQTDKALNVLINQISEHSFLNGFLFATLGHSYNNSGKINEAIESYLSSIKHFENCNEENYIFKPIASLILAYSNIKDIDSMEYYFNKLNKVQRNSISQEVDYLQCRARLNLAKGECLEALSDVDTYLDEFFDQCPDRVALFYVIKLMSLFRLERIEEFNYALSKYKTLTGYKIKENYKYMHSLINYIYQDAPLYIYKKDFKNVEFLYHELNVIKSLDQGEQKVAAESWSFLQKVSCETYLDNFEFDGDQCLFKAALSKSKRCSVGSSSPLIKQKIDFDSIQDYILYLLETNPKGMSKDQLIELIWDSNDHLSFYKRLATNIYRLRSKSKAEISIKNGYYYLKKKENAA